MFLKGVHRSFSVFLISIAIIAIQFFTIIVLWKELENGKCKILNSPKSYRTVGNEIVERNMSKAALGITGSALTLDQLKPCGEETQAAQKVSVVGVAATVFLGSPKWFQNRYSLMVNQMIAILPPDWVIQIFYNPNKKMAIEAVSYPGILRQIARKKVILTPLPSDLSKIKKNELLLKTWFWENMLAENVLLFGGNSVLCANSPLNISNFLGNYDFIGSPWSAFDGRGGSGALSLRNRSVILHALNRWSKTGKGLREDIELVRLLKDDPRIQLAKFQDTQVFAMSEKFTVGEPFGAVGTLAGLTDKMRQKYLDYCPEMKMMFPSLHSPACFGAEPNAIECFRFLCLDGGLKCSKQKDNKIEFLEKGNKWVTLSLSTTVRE